MTITTADGTIIHTRVYGVSNTGKALNEYRIIEHFQEWALLHPDQAPPTVGLPWLLAPLFGQWVLTTAVTDIAGD